MGNSVEIIDPVGGNSVEIKLVDFSDAVEKALGWAVIV